MPARRSPILTGSKCASLLAAQCPAVFLDAHACTGASIRRGNLLVRSLAEIVKPEHFVRESEYLQTVMVVVPKCDRCSCPGGDERGFAEEGSCYDDIYPYQS